MTRPVGRIAFFGYVGSGNIGNDASFETVLGWWREHYPQVQLHCLTIAPASVQQRYGVDATPLAWRPRSPSRTRVGRTLQLTGGRFVDIVVMFRNAGIADAVVVPGMGVLESSLGTRPWGMPFWLFLMAASCRLRRRAFVLLDVGADSPPRRLTGLLSVATVAMATHVSFRDPESAVAMIELGARRPDAVAPDLAFAHSAPKTRSIEPGRLVVGVMAYYGPQDDPIRGATIRRRYVASLSASLAELVDEGFGIVLVGGDSTDEEVADDVESAVRLQRPTMPANSIRVQRCSTFLELSHEMSQAEVVVGSRFHNLICALRAGRPTVSIGYAMKNRHLMEVFGQGELCQDIMDLDARRLTGQVRQAAAEGARISALIQSTLDETTRSVEALLQSVAERLGVDEARRTATTDAARQVDFSSETSKPRS